MEVSRAWQKVASACVVGSVGGPSLPLATGSGLKGSALKCAVCLVRKATEFFNSVARGRIAEGEQPGALDLRRGIRARFARHALGEELRLRERELAVHHRQRLRGDGRGVAPLAVRLHARQVEGLEHAERFAAAHPARKRCGEIPRH